MDVFYKKKSYLLSVFPVKVNIIQTQLEGDWKTKGKHLLQSIVTTENFSIRLKNKWLKNKQGESAL